MNPNSPKGPSITRIITAGIVVWGAHSCMSELHKDVLQILDNPYPEVCKGRTWLIFPASDPRHIELRKYQSCSEILTISATDHPNIVELSRSPGGKTYHHYIPGASSLSFLGNSYEDALSALR